MNLDNLITKIKKEKEEYYKEYFTFENKEYMFDILLSDISFKKNKYNSDYMCVLSKHVVFYFRYKEHNKVPYKKYDEIVFSEKELKEIENIEEELYCIPFYSCNFTSCNSIIKMDNLSDWRKKK